MLIFIVNRMRGVWEKMQMYVRVEVVHLMEV